MMQATQTSPAGATASSVRSTRPPLEAPARAALGPRAQWSDKLHKVGRTLRSWRRTMGDATRLGRRPRAARRARPHRAGPDAPAAARRQRRHGALLITPAAADYYTQQGISFAFHQVLRVLDDPGGDARAQLASSSIATRSSATSCRSCTPTPSTTCSSCRPTTSTVSRRSKIPDPRGHRRHSSAGSGHRLDRGGARLPRSPARLCAPISRQSRGDPARALEHPRASSTCSSAPLEHCQPRCATSRACRPILPARSAT